jgi:2-keto-myo-inositol isomerase
MKQKISRRDMLAGSAAAATLFNTQCSLAGKAPGKMDVRYCLNLSTIRGQELDIIRELEVSAKAGYSGVEPWIRKITAYLESGGTLPELRKRLEDIGLTVEGAIDFARWIVDDDAERAQGLEDIKRSMDIVAQLGGTRIAAPPAGANKSPMIDLHVAAERYRAILEIGDETGVTPTVEIWGHSTNLGRLSHSVFVAVESGHPKACLLPDVYHLFRGGSDFDSLKLLSAAAIPVMHFNDYPGNISREQMKDADRVMPGDGVAPLTQILRDLSVSGSMPVLSLELFSPAWWERDALETARIGLEKMQAVVETALG